MKLTEYAKSGGCAGKLAPKDLDASLKNLPRQQIREILVGYENSDDAGIYELTPEIALVQTIDFFSPVVDDPYTFGQVAAANALSDVYAMGGQPKTALSVVAFPQKGIEPTILGDIMKGGLSKLNEAGVALLGGHSVRDDEIKFGYSVTGVVRMDQIKRNKGARPGARVLLTKPLGAGLITTAVKRGKAQPDHVEQAIASMTRLSRRSSEICLEFRVDTMTDVTGFGLVGHSSEVAKASGISVEIDHHRLPLLPGALDYSRDGFCSGGLTSNREFFSTLARIDESVPPEFSDIVFDPQTSGGLLVFVPPDRANDLLTALQRAEIPAADIGRTLEYSGHHIHII